MMVNPLNYFWTPGTQIDALQPADVLRNPALYAQRVRSAAAWKRLLSGQVNVMRILQVCTQRPWLSVRSGLRDLARSLRIPLTHDLGAELQQITARGVQVSFVFARGEPGVDLLELEGGSLVRKLGDSCRVRIIDCGDHTFSRSTDREALEQVLQQELGVRRMGPAAVS
jgi:hypothetical protein